MEDDISGEAQIREDLIFKGHGRARIWSHGVVSCVEQQITAVGVTLRGSDDGL